MPSPTDAQLRAAGVEAHLARIQADIDALAASSRWARLAVRLARRYVRTGAPLLHRIARRCPTHDRPSYARQHALEVELGMEPSPAPASLADAWYDPALVDCGRPWCTHRRPARP